MKAIKTKNNNSSKISLVVTSINDGKFLTSYCQKISQENLIDKVTLFVIPDRKTPSNLYQKAEILREFGYNIICPTLTEQEEYLKKLGGIFNIVPYDSDNRRNIGYLMAYEKGDEIIISVDDDNYPLGKSDFFNEHKTVINHKIKGQVVSTANGWFNSCRLLKFDSDVVAYPRGYPYFARFNDTDNPKETLAYSDVHLNVGLWLKDPDVDAITWLGLKPHVNSFINKSVILGNKTWTPLNTQNTGLNRAVIPAYWFIKMGYPISGLSIDRYGDIFSGYFAQACAKHLGYGIRIGTPIVDHIRNSHNYLKDVNYELACITVLEDILKWLIDVKLNGATYSECYLSLADQMEDAVQKFDGFVWNTATRGYFHHLAYCMRVWIKTIKIIDGSI